MERMKLETLIVEWQKDSKVDVTEPGKELLRNPQLHGKWAEQLCHHSLALKSHRLSYTALRRIRADYYNGRMSQAELAQRGLTAFQLVLKADVGLYLDADQELQAIEQKIAVHEEAVTFLGSVLKTINNRSFDIRGFIEWVKYTQGGGSA